MEQWCARSGFLAAHFLQKRISPVDLTVKEVKERGSWVGREEFGAPGAPVDGEPGSVKTAVV